MNENFIGKRVIVRGEASGVFYGTFKERDGREICLTNCRRIWYWDGAASISQLATEGPKHPENCMFTVYVEEIIIIDAVEVTLCEELGIKNIEAVTDWKA